MKLTGAAILVSRGMNFLQAAPAAYPFPFAGLAAGVSLSNGKTLTSGVATMAVLPDVVPESALEYHEILHRGGANCGDEDFALCKCPHCARIYLIESEVDTLYLDPADLARRQAINIGVSGFTCESCGGEFPERTPWIGKRAPEAMQVTWMDLAASPWHWIAAKRPEE